MRPSADKPSLFRALAPALAALAAPFALYACGETVHNEPVGPFLGSDAGRPEVGQHEGGQGGSTEDGGAGGGHEGGGGPGTGGAGGQGGAATGSGGSGGETSGAGGFGGAGAGGASGTSTSGAGGQGGGLDCQTVVSAEAFEGATHVPVCWPVVYQSNPPTSGDHYPYWAQYKAYSTPVPRGFFVHDLEHGAVVITYNCTVPCDAEVASLLAYLDTLPADPLCVPPLKNRFLVTPDPLLDVPFAASAWGFSLRSQCFDLPALGTFIQDHYAMASENTCYDGVDVTSPDAGIPADCGSIADAGSD